MEFHKDEKEVAWTKENGEPEKTFDFDAFLGTDGDTSLDDKVTELLGGKELLEPDAFGANVSEYVPGRRNGEDDRGRHEAPEPESTAVEGSWQEESEKEEPVAAKEKASESKPKPKLDPNDPRYAAPERPHIVVAQPRKKVYIDPEVAENEESSGESRGMSEALKWILAALIVVAILGGVFIGILGGNLDIRGFITSHLPSFETSERQPAGGGSAPYVPSTTNTPAPTNTPASNITPEPKIATHNITVTSGSGGAVSPSGVVTVREGESVTFSIVPNSGYALSQLLVDGAPVEMSGTYTFQDVMRDHTIYAVFQQAEPDPTPQEIPVETLEPVTPEPIPEETPEPVTPEPIPEPTAPPAAEPETAPEPIPED